MKISIFVFVPFILSACSPKAEFIPENEILKSATVGVPYFFKVNILGGGVLRGAERKAGQVMPYDAGIYVQNCQIPAWRITENTKDHNCVEIYGTPTKTGIIKITLSGGMHGNMYFSGNHFHKEYTLQVNNP